MKFSDVVSTCKSADGTKATAAKALEDATTADSAAHAAVVSALNTKPTHQAALVDPSGDIDEFSLTPDGSDFVVSVIPGDFEVDAPAPPPAT